jgi:hypothetical protein
MDDFATHNGIKWQGDVGVVQYGSGDTGMVVMFFNNPVRNPAKSAELGRPYFDDKVFVRIHPPGERLSIVEREATQNDMRRFPMQWNQFKENAPQVSDGTPIDFLFSAKPSVAAALKASGVHTVEQLATLSAHAIETIGMGAQQWVNEAARYLEVSNKGVKASQLKAAMDKMEQENHTLQHKVDLLETELNHLREAANKGVTMEDVQKLLANQGGKSGQRGVFAPGKDLVNSTFDAQSAQINSTHATHDLAKKGKAASVPAKRPRARIG